MAKTHLIETTLFDIAFATEEHAFAQQPELASFVRRDLMPIVDELFNESSDGDTVLRIDTLEVDLGMVNYSEYRDELPKRLREELSTILAGMALSGQNAPATGSQRLSQSSNERQQLEYFLIHGHLPWYSKLNGGMLEAALKQLISKNSEWFSILIAQSPSPTTIITRLTLQFSMAVPMLLVQQLSSSHAALAAKLIDELKVFWNSYSKITTQPPLNLDTLLRRFWYRVIDSLLGTAYSLPIQLFYDRVMSELMRHDLGLATDDLGKLTDAAQAGTVVAGEYINSVLRHMFEHSATAVVADEKDEIVLKSGITDEQQLRDLIIAAITGASFDLLTPYWSQLVNEEAQLLTAVLRHYGQQSAIRNRIAFYFPENSVRDIIQLLEPVEHAFVAAVVEDDHGGLISSEKLVDSKGGTDAKKQLWEFSLGYLLVERGSRFNRKSYLGSLVRQMAAHDNMSYSNLLADLTDNISALPASSLVTRQLQQFLAELGQEFAKFDDHADTENKELQESSDHIDILRDFFASGGAVQFDDAVIASAIDSVMHRHPRLLLQLYRQLQAGIPAWQPAVNRLSVPLLQQLITSFLGLMQGQDMSGRSELLEAIKVNAARSNNLRSYYHQLLASLLSGEMIDFDAIMLKSSTETSQLDGALSKTNAKPVTVAKPIQTTGELDINSIKQYLLSDEQLPPRRLAALVNTFELIAQRQPNSLTPLLESVLRDKKALMRLVSLLPERLLVRCLALLRMNEYARLLQCADLVTSACYLRELVPEPALLPRLKWQFIFKHLRETGRLFNERDFAQRYVDFLIEKTQQAEPLRFRAHLSQQLVQNILPSTRDATIRIIEAVANNQASGRQGKIVPERIEPTAPTRRSDQDDQPPVESIYLANAGLVLAAPYLPRLFQMLGLAEKNKFINRDAALRAVHMLQLLVNGQHASPEYLLPLNKLLCGIKSGDIVEPGIDVTPNETAIIEGLLQGMIQNWKALGNTSIAGLRESFLQREGRLQLKDNAWHLLVEPRSFDMLLDQIPWGYSTIKYPWMERVIYVEWR